MRAPSLLGLPRTMNSARAASTRALSLPQAMTPRSQHHSSSQSRGICIGVPATGAPRTSSFPIFGKAKAYNSSCGTATDF